MLLAVCFVFNLPQKQKSNNYEICKGIVKTHGKMKLEIKKLNMKSVKKFGSCINIS